MLFKTIRKKEDICNKEMVMSGSGIVIMPSL